MLLGICVSLRLLVNRSDIFCLPFKHSKSFPITCSSPANPGDRLLQGVVLQQLLGEALSLPTGLEMVKVCEAGSLSTPCSAFPLGEVEK